MTSALQDQLSAIFLPGLLDAVVRYGLPALAWCALPSWGSARLVPRKRRRLSAGYHTLRYPGTPPVEQIRRNVEALLVMLPDPPPPSTELHYL